MDEEIELEKKNQNGRSRILELTDLVDMLSDRSFGYFQTPSKSQLYLTLL